MKATFENISRRLSHQQIYGEMLRTVAYGDGEISNLETGRGRQQELDAQFPQLKAAMEQYFDRYSG